MVQRSLLLFEQGVKSPRTLIGYRDHLNRFLKFVKIKDFDSLISMPPKQLQDLIVDYVMHLKKTVSPNSVATMVTGVKHFFVMNQVLLNWDYIQKLYPAKIKSQGYKAWETDDIKKMLNATKSLRNQAVIHFMASTGCRIGAFDGLKIEHLADMGEGCKGVLIYAGDKEEYWSFLTPEASKALEGYFEQRKIDGERIDKDSPVFRHTYQIGIEKVKALSANAVKNMMFRLINSHSNIQRKKVDKNYDVQIDHGFRKRFNTIMKLENSVNANIAEKILGHRNGLDGVYLTPTKEQCFNEFKKAILNLTVSDEERLKADNIKKQKKLDELESFKIRQDRMQEQLNSFAELNQDVPMTLRKDPKTGKMNLESVDVDMDMFHAGGNEAKADILRKQREAKNQV